MQLEKITQNHDSTLVAEYTPLERVDTAYQSEADLEREFIKILESQGYEYKRIKNENELKINLKNQLEKLNDIKLSDNEWGRFYKKLCETSFSEKTAIIQQNEVQELELDDGRQKNFKLLDKNNIHKNTLQVINQYESSGGKNRYDVSILVNGLPLVHVELKRRGVDLQEAFNQIDRYSRESFGESLFEFVQIFVISNGTFSKYYANTTRQTHIKELSGNNKNKSNHSFEFTSFWADRKNNNTHDLCDFARTFFDKRTILNVLCKYCVFNVKKRLLVMRPYQIAATEQILQKIQHSYHQKLYSKKEQSGGYIWHTTGSGKTLTSFKVAQLASKMGFIDKVLFVVDRKDLDYQTINEYNKFQPNAVDSTKNTLELERKLRGEHKIIVTTIQKLSCFIARIDQVCDKHVVIIFDECHRSQFGKFHKQISQYFKKHYFFGFTGTPILKENASGKETTQSVFGEALHHYLIINAIHDKNVLPFRVDYCGKKYSEDFKQNESRTRSPQEIEKITEYILKHFDAQTKRNQNLVDNKRLKGFNSLFATASINEAMQYYTELKKQNALIPPQNQLKIGIIYSAGASDNNERGFDEENDEKIDDLPLNQREFLESAMNDYNAMFKSNFDKNNFAQYYKDISEKLKNRELDLVVVVNMFLTGFDATTLNTLWVDKNLKYHGLLQAYSRTNRVLDSVKKYGNTVRFHDLEEATDESIKLFGDKDAEKIVFLRKFEDYYYSYKDSAYHKGYKELIEELQRDFPLQNLSELTESKKIEFAKLYGSILKAKNILSCFDEFNNMDILQEREWQDYQGHYIDIYKHKTKRKDADISYDDVVFEIELIKQVEISLEYIIELIRIQPDRQDKDFRTKIEKYVDSGIALRNKKDLILEFIAGLDESTDVDVALKEFIKDKKQKELESIIIKENLNSQETLRYVENAFKNDEMNKFGEEFGRILPPMDIFNKANNTQEKRNIVFESLYEFFDKFRNFRI